MPAPKQLDRWQCADWSRRLVLTALLLSATGILFRGLLAGCLQRWQTEPQYSHGFVIPLLAVGLVWLRRDRIPAGAATSSAIGLVLIAAGCLAHLLAIWFYIEALDSAGLLITLSGLTLAVWGTRCFRGVWPGVLFPVFMLPLPYQLEHLLSDPLQLLGTNQATWLIQTCGIPAIAQGNTILMSDTTLGVAEACSGLRMLMVFAAVAAATVSISRRLLWERLVILVSSVPIAIFCNVVRIVATAVVHETLGRQTADLVFHDLSGWLMMPLAMVLLFLELKLLDVLFVPAVRMRPVITAHRIRPLYSVSSHGGGGQ